MSGEQKTPPASTSEDRQVKRDERTGADRCWIWRNAFHEPCVTFTKPDAKVHPSVEYMRVLSRDEAERLVNSEEGCDTQQLLNSLYRQIEGQKRHIALLEAEKKAHRCHHALDEALNSGDGSYRP